MVGEMDSLTTIHVKEFRLSKQYIDADSVCSPLCSPSLMTCPCSSRKTAWYLALLDCVAGFCHVGFQQGDSIVQVSGWPLEFIYP